MSTNANRSNGWLDDFEGASAHETLLGMSPPPIQSQAQTIDGTMNIGQSDSSGSLHHLNPPLGSPSLTEGAIERPISPETQAWQQFLNPLENDGTDQQAHGNRRSLPSRRVDFHSTSLQRGQHEFTPFHLPSTEGLSMDVTEHSKAVQPSQSFFPGTSFPGFGVNRSIAGANAHPSQHQNYQYGDASRSRNPRHNSCRADENLILSNRMRRPTFLPHQHTGGSEPANAGRPAYGLPTEVLSNTKRPTPRIANATQGKNVSASMDRNSRLAGSSTAPDASQAPADSLVSSLPSRKTIRPVIPQPGVENYTFQGKFTTAAAASAFLNLKEKIELGIDVDDVPYVKVNIQQYCRQAFEALTAAPEAAGRQWKDTRKREYQGGQDNAMTTVINMMATLEGLEMAEAVASDAIHRALGLHDVGAKKGMSAKFKIELGYSCSARCDAVIATLRGNKLCCKDLLEGNKVEQLIYAPKLALKTKRDNTGSNANKAVVLNAAAQSRKTTHALEGAEDDEIEQIAEPAKKKRKGPTKPQPSGDNPAQSGEIHNSAAAMSSGGSKKLPGKARGGKAKGALRPNFENDETPGLNMPVQQSMPSLRALSAFDPNFNYAVGSAMQGGGSVNRNALSVNNVLAQTSDISSGSGLFRRPAQPHRHFDAGALTTPALLSARPGSYDDESEKTTRKSSRLHDDR